MPRIRSTQCRVCGQPREEGSADLLCQQHRRERDRLERQRGRQRKVTSQAKPSGIQHPRGACKICGGGVLASGRCHEHLKQYKREWALAERRRRGVGHCSVDEPAIPRPSPPAMSADPKRRARHLDDVPCLVGLEFVDVVVPIIPDRPLVRHRAPGQVAEEKEREMEWAKWFQERGL